MSALEPSIERSEIRSAIRDVLGGVTRSRGAVHPDSGVAEIDAALARAVAEEFGVAGLVVPEALGGSGGDFADLGVITEELGAALSPIALFSTTAQAVPLLRALPESAGDELLGVIAEGRTRVAIITMADAVHGARGDDVSVSGEAWPVIDGGHADIVLVVAGSGEQTSVIAVEAYSPGVTIDPMRSIDVTRSFARVTLEHGAGRVISTTGVERAHMVAHHAATVMLAAEQVGGAQHVLDSAVDYAKVREQFGRRIGSFQAIQHALVDLMLEVESARAAQLAAVDAVDAYFAAPGEETLAELALAAAVAGAAASSAYRLVSDEGLHLQGGIGFTWEHHSHLYFRRALADDVISGTTETNLDRVAARAGL